MASRRVILSPTAMLDMRRVEVDRMQGRFLAAAERMTAEKRRRDTHLAASLDALSPLKVLSRGYSIASDESGHVVKDISEIQKGAPLRIKLARGTLGCRVENKWED